MGRGKMHFSLKRFAPMAAAVLLISAQAAEARGLRGSLANMKPSRNLQQGQCDITIDCPNYRIMIDGQKVGEIICGRQTAQKFRTGKLATKITPAAGKILPAGFPMLDTVPSLCHNCFIHVYPWTGPGSKSLGCVGVQEAAWNKILRCGGSSFNIIPMGAKGPNTATAPASGTSGSRDSAGTAGGRR